MTSPLSPSLNSLPWMCKHERRLCCSFSSDITPNFLKAFSCEWILDSNSWIFKFYSLNLSSNVEIIPSLNLQRSSSKDWTSLPKTDWLIFFLIGIHSMQGWTATTRHGVTRKEAQKRLQDTENLFRKNLQLKDVC